MTEVGSEYLIQCSQQPYRKGTVIMPSLWARDLGREVAQGHIPRIGEDLKPCLTPEAVLSWAPALSEVLMKAMQWSPGAWGQERVNLLPAFFLETRWSPDRPPPPCMISPLTLMGEMPPL